MSTKMTSSIRRHSDHFEPQDTDPQEQRRLRGRSRNAQQEPREARANGHPHQYSPA